MANILANPLCDMSVQISELVKPSGKLVLSGILNEQADKVIQAYQSNQLVMKPMVSQDEWCRLEGKKR